VRATLVNALSTCAAERLRESALRFLEGLSSDELQYIAGFLGACILESGTGTMGLQSVGAFAAHRAGLPPYQDAGMLNDQEHKMVLLLEYLCRCGLMRLTPA
jgi:hypothetical protein